MSPRRFLAFRRMRLTSAWTQTQTNLKTEMATYRFGGVVREARAVREVSQMAGVPVPMTSRRSCDLLNEETRRLQIPVLPESLRPTSFSPLSSCALARTQIRAHLPDHPPHPHTLLPTPTGTPNPDHDHTPPTTTSLPLPLPSHRTPIPMPHSRLITRS